MSKSPALGVLGQPGLITPQNPQPDNNLSSVETAQPPGGVLVSVASEPEFPDDWNNDEPTPDDLKAAEFSSVEIAQQIGGAYISEVSDLLWLELKGARFCKVTAWDAPGDSPGKKPIGLAWQNNPLTWAQVKPHVDGGGNVGLICGQHSGGLIMVDVDYALPGFLAEFPQYANYPRIERGHPDKAKFLLRLPAGQEWTDEKKYRKDGDKHPFLEILVTGNQGVIPPSKHPEGGLYRFINIDAEIPTITPEQLAADVARWAEIMIHPAPASQAPAAEADQTERNNGSDPALRDSVKKAWPPLKVFEHFGIAANGTRKEGKFTRLFGNGGLFVNDNGKGWNIPGEGSQAGGDSFDAWYYCQTKKYKCPKSEFRKTLLEMATAAGIPIPAPATKPAKKKETAPSTPQADGGQAGQPTDDTFIHRCFERGETGDAELFDSLFSQSMKFDRSEKRFYIWQGTRWAPDDLGKAVRLVQNDLAAEYLYKGADLRKAGDADTSKEYFKRAGSLMSASRINNVLGLAESQPNIALTGQEWDIDPMILPVKNGLIDLRAGTFRPTTPADMVRTFSPVEWPGLNEPAPVWEKTILEIFGGDPDLVNFARRLFGYSITGTTREQVLPILYGDGANGKSTILEVLAAVLGESFGGPTSADSLMDTKHGDGNAASPYVYAMRGKRLVWANESKEGQRLNTGLVKQLTGDSLITARPLFGNPVTFQQTHKIMLITNHLPRIPDSDDYAIWRRILRIPFNMRFVEKPTQTNERKINKDLPEQLKAEYPGILAWLVRGCLEWQAQGLEAPAAVVKATEKYREDEDLVGQFIDERMITGPDKVAMAGEIYKAYTVWCEKYGYNPMSAKALGSRLKSKYSEPIRKTAGMQYQGIGLLA